jgi:tetratricopeptide (TPR) repeat protein
MEVKNIFSEKSLIKIFVITDSNDDNILNWTIKETQLELIPDYEGHFIVAAKQVFEDKTVDCYIDMTATERITDFVIRLESNKAVGELFYDYSKKNKNSIIPAIASDCFGIYELYYSKENPDAGIDILKEGLTKSLVKSAIAEDLGYILRDENRTDEAIEAFLISVANGPSSIYIYDELAQLYRQLGKFDKQLEFQNKFEKSF